MEAVIKLKVKELDALLVEKIKTFFAENEDAVLTISVDVNETPYMEALRRSKDDLENGRNLLSFTMEELEAYANSKRP